MPKPEPKNTEVQKLKLIHASDQMVEITEEVISKEEEGCIKCLIEFLDNLLLEFRIDFSEKDTLQSIEDHSTSLLRSLKNNDKLNKLLEEVDSLQKRNSKYSTIYETQVGRIREKEQDILARANTAKEIVKKYENLRFQQVKALMAPIRKAIETLENIIDSNRSSCCSTIDLSSMTQFSKKLTELANHLEDELNQQPDNTKDRELLAKFQISRQYAFHLWRSELVKNVSLVGHSLNVVFAVINAVWRAICLGSSKRLIPYYEDDTDVLEEFGKVLRRLSTSTLTEIESKTQRERREIRINQITKPIYEGLQRFREECFGIIRNPKTSRLLAEQTIKFQKSIEDQVIAFTENLKAELSDSEDTRFFKLYQKNCVDIYNQFRNLFTSKVPYFLRTPVILLFGYKCTTLLNEVLVYDDLKEYLQKMENSVMPQLQAQRPEPKGSAHFDGQQFLKLFDRALDSVKNPHSHINTFLDSSERSADKKNLKRLLKFIGEQAEAFKKVCNGLENPQRQDYENAYKQFQQNCIDVCKDFPSTLNIYKPQLHELLNNLFGYCGIDERTKEVSISKLAFYNLQRKQEPELVEDVEHKHNYNSTERESKDQAEAEAIRRIRDSRITSIITFFKKEGLKPLQDSDAYKESVNMRNFIRCLERQVDKFEKALREAPGDDQNERLYKKFQQNCIDVCKKFPVLCHNNRDLLNQHLPNIFGYTVDGNVEKRKLITTPNTHTFFSFSQSVEVFLGVDPSQPEENTGFSQHGKSGEPQDQSAGNNTLGDGAPLIIIGPFQ